MQHLITTGYLWKWELSTPLPMYDYRWQKRHHSGHRCVRFMSNGTLMVPAILAASFVNIFHFVWCCFLL